MFRGHNPLGWAILGLSLIVTHCGYGDSGEDNAAAGRAPVPSAMAREAPRTGPRKLALLVGINDYKHARPRLRGPLNDVAAMKTLLTSPAYGFVTADIHVLLDAQATREKILKEIDDYLIRKASPGAVVVFYFSGHGSLCDNPDDPTREDNTLVPWDARDPEGRVGDIRDKELNVRARRLSEQVGDTGGVTFILDSCHSGTGIKAAGTPRSLDKGPRCGPQRAILATEGSGYGADGLRYVLIAGSRTDQTSFERRGADGKIRGALTENLIRELLRPSTVRRTYRDIMDRVIFAVQGEYTNQIPQLEGTNRDQVVFGTDTIETRNYVPASAAGPGQVRLGGGQLLGLTRGSQFDVYGPEAHTFEPPERPLTRATLGSPEAFSTLATISPVVPIPEGAKATEREHNFEAQKTHVFYDGLDRSAALRQLAGVLQRTPTHAFESVAAGQSFQIRVSEEAGFVRTFGADGRELSTKLSVTTPRLAAILEERILAWTRWLGLLALRNPAAGDLVKVTLVPIGSTPSTASTPSFTPNEQAYDLKIKNLTDRRLLVYVVDLTSRGTARQIYPPDIGVHIPLAPREEMSIRGGTELPAGVSFSRDVYKVITAIQQLDLSYLEMDVPKGTDPMPRAPTDPLNRLLFEAAMGVRDGRLATAVGWGTADVAFEVCLELDRNGRCVPPPSGGR